MTQNPKNYITTIQKRDSRRVPFDQGRITDVILKALKAVKGVADESLAKKISDEAVVELNKKFVKNKKVTRIPKVEQIQDSVIKALQECGEEEVADAYLKYRQKRQEIREDKYWLLYRDIKTHLSENSLKVLESRYLLKDENGKIIETPQDLFKRVASNIAAAEKNYNPDISDDELFKTEEEFYKLMATLKFLPNSPALMNAGAPLQQLAACFVLPVDDSLDSIFDALKSTALIHQSGGGTGFSFARLRPSGDRVRTSAGVASGPISFMRIFDTATDVIKQGGKRRGANMGILRVDHPDILDFIVAKQKEGLFQNFNISVSITDDFMDALVKNKKYSLINPRTGFPVKELEAKEVFDLIVKMAWETGDPGVIFIDRVNNERGNPTPKLGMIEATNPCGEQPLLPYESCDLGSINLEKIVKIEKNNKPDIDWEDLRETIWSAVHFLDNVIDMNRYPLPEIEKVSKGNRRIGLGVMGLADMLVRLGLPYNCEAAYELSDKIMEFIDIEARKASVELAEKRGVFPNFKDSVYNQKNQTRLRNAALTTIAPTGTISLIADCSSGIEPIFALAYIRKSHIGQAGDDWVDLINVHPLFEEVAKREEFWSKEVMESIVEHGSAKGVKGVPEKWQKIFTTAHDLSSEEHVKMQAIFQKHVDNAVSKTINFPNNATLDDIKEAYLLSWKLGCKGITVYRDASKAQQVLNIGLKKEEKKEATLDFDPNSIPGIETFEPIKDPLPPPQISQDQNPPPAHDAPPGLCIHCD